MPIMKQVKGVDARTGLPSREPNWSVTLWGKREVWKVVKISPDGKHEHRMMDPRDMKLIMSVEGLRMFGTRPKYSHDLVFFGENPAEPVNEGGSRVVNNFFPDNPLKEKFTCRGNVYEIRDDDLFWTVSLPDDAVKFLRADSYWRVQFQNGVVVAYVTGRGKADLSFQHEADRKAFRNALKAWTLSQREAA
ncbi:hypothetical protein [Bosea sp. ANAM02]|uniref:hypothetical protein n=1 Tax=Bosea sp. ANAM02 TaxID=2020412 RepID=UPI00140F1D87|nr:hypothetical protein [Bosea sp. ANAM02]BCB19211.1 hypothetical protein OCUBac02_21050 [Bosea sp. ANAM02]